MKRKAFRRKLSWSNQHSISEGFRKAAKRSQDSQHPGKVSNRAPHEHKSRALSLDQPVRSKSIILLAIRISESRIRPWKCLSYDRETQKHKETFVLRADFEPAIPVFESPKSVDAIRLSVVSFVSLRIKYTTLSMVMERHEVIYCFYADGVSTFISAPL
jgi:hypothetical protein